MCDVDSDTFAIQHCKGGGGDTYLMIRFRGDVRRVLSLIVGIPIQSRLPQAISILGPRLACSSSFILT